MARTEVVAKRTRTGKVFDNGDGTFTLEARVGAVHHQKNGQWVDTDTNWTDLTDKWSTGEYPFVVDFMKQTRTLTVDFGTDSVALTPYNSRNPTDIVKATNTLTFVRLWTGITLICYLTPEGIAIHFIKTATTYVNPAFTVVGDFNAHWGPTRYYDSAARTMIDVPQSIVGGILTYDFSGVPVGVEVE